MRPIYFFHIRKCAGQSIYHSLLRALTDVPSRQVEQVLAVRNKVSINGIRLVGWDGVTEGLENFAFAFSHHSYEDVTLPKDAFVFTCFRDPIERTISYYRMLRGFADRGDRPDVIRNEHWGAAETLSEFLDLCPRRHYSNQLYMFSSLFTLSQALERVRKLDYYFFVDEFEQGMDGLEERLDLSLLRPHITFEPFEYEPAEEELDKLQEMLADEITFYNEVRDESRGFWE